MRITGANRNVKGYMAKTPPSGTRRSTSTGADITASAAGTAKSTKKRETLQYLRRDVEDILARLRQADSLTRKSVKSLQTAFSVLEKRVSDDGSVNKAALNQRVDQLTERLTGIIKQTHQAVAQDLSKARTNPSIDRLSAAVKAAEERMANAELAQADALSKVNRHLAGMAKAIDARFKQESVAGQSRLDNVNAAIKTSQAQTDKKLSEIEKASAEALLKIGERVVALSDEMNARSDRGLESVAEKIEQLDVKTKSDFETYRADLESYRSDFERRVEGLEETQRNLDSYTDRSIAKLTARIDNLEYGLTSVAPPPSPNAGAPDNEEVMPLTLSAPVIDDPFSPDTPSSMSMSVQTQLDVVSEGRLPPAPEPEVPSLFTPTPVIREPSAPTAVAPAPAQPAVLLTLVAQPGTGTPQAFSGSDIPQSPADMTTPPAPSYAEPYPVTAVTPTGAVVSEYTPSQYPTGEYVPDPYPQLTHDYAPDQTQMEAPVYTADPAIAPDNMQAFGQSDPVYDLQNGQTTTADMYAPVDNPEDITAEDLPYDDPAYAENISDGGMQRPGSFKTKKKAKKRKVKAKAKPKVKAVKKAKSGGLVTNRKVQAASLAIIVATVGYFALRGGSNAGTAPQGGLGIVVDDGTRMAPIADLTGDTASASETGEDVTGQTPAEVSLPAIGEYQDNQGLTGSGEKIEANTLEAAAKNGDPVAEFQLGLSHLQAGRSQSAVRFIRSSANKGQAAAQYRLAKLYESGEGVTADAAMARQLTERAARNGNRIAMHDLALYYAEGRGDVDVDIKVAAKWFEKAALRGVVDSQYNLGVLYESGQGLPQNLAEAYVWYGIAARQGDQYAKQHLDVLKTKITEDDVTRAKSRVAEFKPVSIDESANGIFRNLAWAEPVNLKVNSARAQIRETQTLLGQLGYDAGGADGSMGPKTRAAIVSFQKKKGLSETGKVDQALIVQLQKAAGA